MTTRSNLLEILQLLASEQEQLEYERQVPHVNVTDELVCMWFDDHYHPGPELDTAFSPCELAMLGAFHDFYDHRVGKLPDSQGTVQTWHASPVWREIMEEARRTVSLIGETG